MASRPTDLWASSGYSTLNTYSKYILYNTMQCNTIGNNALTWTILLYYCYSWALFCTSGMRSSCCLWE